MKTLILNRHAKSDWDHPGLHDFERPLNNRGMRDAPYMANIFAERNIKVDMLYSSTAVRAKTTAEFFINELNLAPSQVNFTKEIYNSGITFVRETLPLLNDKINSVMYFGHNPDFSSLVKYYSATNVGTLTFLRDCYNYV